VSSDRLREVKNKGKFQTFSPETGRGRDYSTVLPAHLIHDLICTPSEVAKVLNSLDVNKACGPDGVSARLLNECYMELAPILARLFNYTLSRGTLPIDWKSANVVPIFKSGEQTAVDNYRPVSLTSVVVKSLERLVHNHIVNFFLIISYYVIINMASDHFAHV